ncbi:MAG: ATP-dependent sacrificial sulfur transferase LarE [Deltaproteobacteria bacterium]|nr:ATP-dependent sacrificial sulfur transferase LarE [Deltaproteobacteria bacterium]MBN2672173.1 ATP-dependent sacrificial sulfur transferase LarE [Deltaproteobacteria bacterium]
MKNKYNLLLTYLRELESVAVAYSGGVDSTFLLAAATEALGANALGIIGRSPTYPKREQDDAVALAEKMGARIHFIDTDEIHDEAFYTNPPTRCFACKSTLFTGVWTAATELGCKYVLEGSNADDLGDFRPGMDAAHKLNVKAPLVELAFTKAEIRTLSKEMGLPTWNKPAFACLSSRIPYGQQITTLKLGKIERAENALRDLGFVGIRVRDYNDLCRVEVPPSDIPKMVEPPMRKNVVQQLKNAGYQFVCLDLEGYRTGSMNETLSSETKINARKQG